jgi:nucleotide-binding universal stress UspA family protein
MRLRRILLCVDGSRASFQAARESLELAAQTGAGLVALSVIDSGQAVAGLADGARRESDARAALERVARMGREQGVAIELQTRTGTAFEQILEVARQEGADLVVMGRTGRRGVGSGMMGSSALRVAEFADRPLLLVPARAGGAGPATSG